MDVPASNRKMPPATSPFAVKPTKQQSAQEVRVREPARPRDCSEMFIIFESWKTNCKGSVIVVSRDGAAAGDPGGRVHVTEGDDQGFHSPVRCRCSPARSRQRHSDRSTLDSHTPQDLDRRLCYRRVWPPRIASSATGAPVVDALRPVFSWRVAGCAGRETRASPGRRGAQSSGDGAARLSGVYHRSERVSPDARSRGTSAVRPSRVCALRSAPRERTGSA